MITLEDFQWRIAGEAGQGILNAGLMLAKTLINAGYYVFSTSEYPSLIRGGHNSLDIRAAPSEIFSTIKRVDILLALNTEAVNKHKDEVAQKGVVLYDPKDVSQNAVQVKEGVHAIAIPMKDMAVASGGEIMKNTVGMGATVALLCLDISLFEAAIRKEFEKKGEEVINQNIEAAKKGHDFIKEKFKGEFRCVLKSLDAKELYMLTGNDALSGGAIKAGCKLLAAYPMTPATSIMLNLAAQEHNYDLVVKHTEDELAAMNTAIGAGFAGVRAMVSTSGGGFALMTEAFGMAAATETPVVAVDAQRPGPSSGLATHTGQGDLRFLLHASQDEFPRFVMAPGTVEECFHLMIDAFNYAERYQSPVIVIMDKFLSSSYCAVHKLDSRVPIDRGALLSDEEAAKQQDYKRYKITDNGISPRAIPGQRGTIHTGCSYVHDEYGYECEDPANKIAQHQKLYRKFDIAAKEIPQPELEGAEDADVTFVSWGSSRSPIKEAIRMLGDKGIKANHLHIRVISPLPEQKIIEVAKNAKTLIHVEGNMTAQLAGYIRERTGVHIEDKILKYDGRPFFPEEIVQGTEKILGDAH